MYTLYGTMINVRIFHNHHSIQMFGHGTCMSRDLHNSVIEDLILKDYLMYGWDVFLQSFPFMRDLRMEWYME